jgi:tRNA (guanine37-N1)-methyltransferase
MTKSAWQATILTLFPEMFPGPLGASLAGKSLKDGIWALKTLDIRQFASDKHRTVDEAPLGGGVGMVLKPDVVACCAESCRGGTGAPNLPDPEGSVA